jgi:hypothetical protein
MSLFMPNDTNHISSLQTPQELSPLKTGVSIATVVALGYLPFSLAAPGLALSYSGPPFYAVLAFISAATIVASRRLKEPESRRPPSASVRSNSNQPHPLE